jgi:hypothetical protein
MGVGERGRLTARTLRQPSHDELSGILPEHR